MEEEPINVKAFLKLIRFAEHGRDDDGVYMILYGGATFAGVAAHPNKAVTKWGHTSTAAGAYQILYKTWEDAKKNGIVLDFSRASQDILAIKKLHSRGAYAFVVAGDVENAIAKLRSEWTSLPGAKQSKITMVTAKEKFVQYVKELEDAMKK
jgi:lysozyme